MISRDMQLDILDALSNGSHLHKIHMEGFPHHNTLDRYRRACPAFNAEIRAILVDRETKQRRQRFARLHINPDQLYRMVDKAVSKTYPAHIRDDIISSAALAVLEGEIKSLDQIAKEIPKHITAYWRLHDHKRNVSIDAPLFAGSSQTYHDFLTTKHSA